MLIVIEGVDKAGKSTLANKLSELLSWPVVHFGKPGPDPALEYIKFLQDLGTKNIICDRFYAGELVYGPLLRGKQVLTPLQVVTIERQIRAHLGIMIHVNPPFNIIEERYHKLGDDLITLPQNKRAYEMFNTVCPMRKVHLNLQWDGSGDINKIAQKIVGVALDLQQKSWVCTRSATGIGTVYGEKIVFVGEKVNEKTTWVGLPFDSGPCADYLLRGMLLAGLDDRKVYITNANTISTEEVNALKEHTPAQFIALGNVASEKLKTLGIAGVKIPHPQFWNRFHHQDIEGYSMLIKNAIAEAYTYNVYSSLRQYN